MQKQNTQANIVKRWGIIIAVVTVLAGAYYYFVSYTPVLDTQVGTLARVPGQKSIILLHELEVINLSTDFFDSPAFRSLTDYTVNLIEEPIGRDNPFAPIGTN